MQKVSKSGRKYNEGSHSKFGGWEPRNCHVCGGRVLVKSGFFMNPTDGQPRSYHHECFRKERYGEVHLLRDGDSTEREDMPQPR